MKHFSEYLNESINHIYTLTFGQNEKLSSGNGTRFKVEFVDVIDCKKRIENYKQMDNFAAPLFKEHYNRDLDKEPNGQKGGCYYRFSAGDHSKDKYEDNPKIEVKI